MKRYSILLVTRKRQIKTTMRYYYTLIRMAIMKKQNKNPIPHLGEDMNNENSHIKLLVITT